MEDTHYLEFIDEKFKFFPSCYVFQKKATIDLKKFFTGLILDWLICYDYSSWKKKVKNKKNIKSHVVNIQWEEIKFIYEFFKYDSFPYFVSRLDSNFLWEYKEQDHWYLLIIEIWEFIFIQKTWWIRQISPTIKKTFNLINLNSTYRDRLIYWYDKLEKLKIHNVNSNTNEIDIIEIEAEDLTKVVSSWEYANFFARNIKAGNSTNKKTLTINAGTSRLQFANQEIEANLTSLIGFYVMHKIILDKAIEATELLENKIIKFNDNLAKNTDKLPMQSPKYLSFMLSEIEQEFIEEDNFFDIQNILDKFKWFHLLKKSWEDIITDDIEVGKYINLWEGYIVDDYMVKISYTSTDEIYRELFRVIQDKQLFKLSYDLDKISYINGSFYENRNYEIPYIDVILNSIYSFIPSSVTSEKWLYSEYVVGSNSNWSVNSIFYHVEDILKNDSDIKYLFCGDMWKEIADHISFSSDTITFIHWKATGRNRSTKSVSDFSDLIGQVIKNMWFLPLDKDVTKEEIIKLASASLSPAITKWKPIWVSSDKNVTKKSLIKWNEVDFENFLDNFLNGQQFFKKRVVLAVDFFDKNFIENRLNKYKVDPWSLDFLDIQFINTLWMLESMCKRRWTIFEIWCK